MIRIDANLASRPFVNHRKFYMISGGLLALLLTISYWNFTRYQSTRARRGEVNERLSRDRARFEALGREQEKVLARLQTPETTEFLDTLEHVNQLIRRRTFSWTQLLNDLERLTPANLQIVTIKPQIANKGIIIEIVANGRSSRDNVQFVSNLESSGKFYDVSPLHEEISKNPAFVGREIAVQVKYKGQS
jgi:type IV pilus assembly protein PilN